MSIKWEFRDSRGRRVSEREWLKGLERDAVAAATDSIEAAISRVRCPIHGSSPQNIRRSKSGDQVRWEWDACCDEQEAAVQRAIS